MEYEEWETIFPYELLCKMNGILQYSKCIQEIRLRINCPVMFLIGGEEFFLTQSGKAAKSHENAVICKREYTRSLIQHLCQDSVYAYEEEIKKGYLTIKGGHRIGVAGEVVLTKEGQIQTIRNICYINIRIAHEVIGAADTVMPMLYHSGRFMNTLIVSPPGCGKTTMLRDIVRQVSNGNRYGHALQTAVVDERSEIAGTFRGEAQKDIGIRTDVLDACPKSLGMMMLLRSMAPQVMAIDELGGENDIEALYHVINSGTDILVTVHGENIEEVSLKRGLGRIIADKIFKRYIILQKREGKYEISKVLNEDLKNV